MSEAQVIQVCSPYLGCDPEIFIAKKGGEIVGAERVIPEAGLDTPTHSGTGINQSTNKRKGIVLDGVQAELNPAPTYCRALLCGEISAAFVTLRKHLEKMDGMEVCFKQVVEVDAKELDTLSDKAKILGCAPSRNVYDSKASIGIDPSTYNKRSAGGHIHLGFDAWKQLMDNRAKLVVLMDILVGNTAVLIDRDPGNAERRKVYGRAGEHRLPKHGLEYRTLSNFWLRSYPLASMVFAMSRLAVNVLANDLYAAKPDTVKSTSGEVMPVGNGCMPKTVEALLDVVDVEKVQKAINTNDLTLAKENWEGVSRFLLKHTTHYSSGITANNLADFNHFIKRLDENGIEYWFPHDPLIAWTDKFGAARNGILWDGATIQNVTDGWEAFLEHSVQPDRLGERLYKAA